MRCESLGPRLSAWVDGELSWLDAWLVARHVASCPTCAAEVEDLRALNMRLAAANPVFTPLEAPIRAARPMKALVGAGALVATGVLGFFLLPRPQEVVSLSPAPTPAAKVSIVTPVPEKSPEGAGAGEAKKVPPPVVVPPPVARRSEAPVVRVRSSTRVADAKPRTTSRSFRVARRPASKPGRVSPRRRVRTENLPTKPVMVAKAETSPMDIAPSGLPLTSAPAPAIEVSPELDSMTRDARHNEALSMAGPPPAIVAAAKPSGDVDSASTKMKRDARTRTFGAATARAITPAPGGVRETSDALVPRKRVVPVLVVTPTRYENVVTVTAGAIEVDDETDDREETSQP